MEVLRALLTIINLSSLCLLLRSISSSFSLHVRELRITIVAVAVAGGKFRYGNVLIIVETIVSVRNSGSEQRYMFYVQPEEELQIVAAKLHGSYWPLAQHDTRDECQM